MKMSEVLTVFLSEADVKSSSLLTYERVLRLFFRYLSKNKLEFDKIKRSDIINWKVIFKNDHEPKTLNLYLSVIKRFYAWANISGIYSDIAKGIKMEKVPHIYRRFPLTIEESQRLLSSINTERERGKRDHALVNLMLLTGLRRIEVHRLDVGDLIQLGDQYVLKIQRKGHSGKDNYKPISNEVFDELNDLICLRQDIKGGDPLFITLNKSTKGNRLSVNDISTIVKAYLNKIGLTNEMYSCHSLRHTTAVLLLKSGKNLYYVQQFMGHSSPATTQLYTKVIGDILKDDSEGVEILQKLLKNREVGV